MPRMYKESERVQVCYAVFYGEKWSGLSSHSPDISGSIAGHLQYCDPKFSATVIDAPLCEALTVSFSKSLPESSIPFKVSENSVDGDTIRTYTLTTKAVSNGTMKVDTTKKGDICIRTFVDSTIKNMFNTQSSERLSQSNRRSFRYN